MNRSQLYCLVECAFRFNSLTFDYNFQTNAQIGQHYSMSWIHIHIFSLNTDKIMICNVNFANVIIILQQSYIFCSTEYSSK